MIYYNKKVQNKLYKNNYMTFCPINRKNNFFRLFKIFKKQKYN